MNWITLEEIVLVHERVIAETGGLLGMVNPGGLESALIRPFTAFSGYELFVDLHSKVAVLVDSIIAFHLFADGNKRTALVAADVCLRLNGYRLVPSGEVERFFWAAARGGAASGGVAVEQIDIGGPTLIRAAAKNWESVAVLVDASQYGEVLDELKGSESKLSGETRYRLAREAFRRTGQYGGRLP